MTDAELLLDHRAMTLLEKTKALAIERAYQKTAVCKAIGVSIRWLDRMLAGDYADPGVGKIERLHEILEACPIKS